MMNKSLKRIALLGSTGSIGTQTLDVLHRMQDDFVLHSIVAFNEVNILDKQIKDFHPSKAALFDNIAAEKLSALTNIPVLSGNEGIISLVEDPEVDIVVNAIAGAAGLLPGLAAIRANKRLLSANKECFVMAGHIFRDAMKNGGDIIPIDSEHSALLQASLAGKHKEIKELILTASGGPFFNKDIDFNTITPEQALAHPNWSMGQKISIDSATMFNKALEIIEARWLFDIPSEQISVLIHPQSIIHSLVEFNDYSQIAQLSLPDMRLPIQYALTYPDRKNCPIDKLNLAEIKTLTFHEVPVDRFPAISYAYKALELGSLAATVANAADEIAVSLFLSEKISFADISRIIGAALDHFAYDNSYPEIDEIILRDRETREWVMKKYP